MARHPHTEALARPHQSVPRFAARSWGGERLNRAVFGYALILPALLLYAVFALYPMV